MPAERRLCEGLNRKGKPCRQQARPGSHFCALHDPDLTNEQRARIVSPRWAAVAEAEKRGEL